MLIRLPRLLFLTTCVLLAFILSACEALGDVIEYVIGDDSGGGDNPVYPSDGNNPPAEAPKTAYITGYDATMEISQFICHDAEEDDYVTSSGQDEIVFIYSLVETDESGWVVRAATYAWGPFDVYAGDAYNANYFTQLQLTGIPVGHGLMSLFNVTDIEDYSEAQSYMNKINEYMRYIKIANMFNPEPQSKAAIEIVSDILYYSGKTLDVVDWLDDDDTLFDHIDMGNYNQIYPTLQSGGNLFNSWNFYGTNNTDNFNYDMAYTVYLYPEVVYR